MDEWQPPEGPVPETPPPKKRGWLLLLVALAALGAVGAALWFFVLAPRGPEETVAGAGSDAGEAAPDAGAPALKDLAEGDALLRKLAAGWSSSPEFARWLATSDLIRRLTAAVNLVADGDSPRSVLSFLDVKGPFAVKEVGAPKAKRPPKAKHGKRPPPPERRGRLFIAPESYARYDGITRVFASVDAAAAGKAYGQLRPYFDTAFFSIGKPGRRFDDVLAAAIRRLTSVQLLEGEVELVPKGAVYAFKDPSIESLSAAEKHLLRMGPKNGKMIQDSLRRFSESAGIGIGP